MHRPSFRRILLITLIGVSVISSVAIGQESVEIAGQVEISDDEEGPQNLAWDGDSIWYSNINTKTIYQVDPTSGKITQSIETRLDSPSGIEATNDSLWVVTDSYDEKNYIHKLDPETGEEISKIPAPGSSSRGLAYDGQNLWTIAESESGTGIYKIKPQSGEVVKSLEAGRIGSTSGLAWGKGFLWVSDSEHIAQIDPSTPSGELVQKFESPYVVPTGVAWDGGYLWETETVNNTITRVNIGRVSQTNSPPNASFEHSPNQPTAGNRISFDGSSSTDSDGVVEEYQWDFDGDGISDAQGEQATYTYESPGNYAVNLTVVDDKEVTGSTTKQISVGEANADQPNAGSAGADSADTRRQSTPTATHTAQPVEESTSQSSDSRQEDSGTKERTAVGNGESRAQQERGFLTNSDSGLLNFLGDPLFLTVGGFIASAIGILLQLFGGQ
ncbi:PKD domain-containing protein [Halococcus qingdaonensis]|uniref:PKD domain-containing protein n=1 Tax=Halococcus qingdaonensis TaxID=224402 RepID=UPI0021165BD9|nr:PKD domain-containing protein [Halococcus qingdaonensis]